MDFASWNRVERDWKLCHEHCANFFAQWMAQIANKNVSIGHLLTWICLLGLFMSCETRFTHSKT